MIRALPQRVAYRARHSRRALGIVWAAAPGYTVAWGLLTLVQGLIPPAVVYVTKWVVDGVNEAIGAGFTAEAVQDALLPALLMVGLVLLRQVLSGETSYVQTAQAELTQDHVKALIHAKAAEVDYAFYESDDYHNKLQDAHTQASGRILGLLGNVGGLARAAISFTAIAAILATYAWWLPLALFAGATPGLLVIIRHNRIYRTWWDGSLSDQRMADYLDHMLVLPDFAAETRVYGFGPWVAESYQGVRKGLREDRLRLLRRQVLARFGAALLTLVGVGGVMGWMVWRALHGLATIGDLALFYQAVTQGQSNTGSLLGGVGSAYTNALFLEQLFAFLDLEPELQDPPDAAPLPSILREGVRFENVSFAYPGATRPALDGLDLELPLDQITAIVGVNGAGKSTLVKLLCRFYDPQAGRVTLDGVDIRRVRKGDLLRTVGVMFQRPVRHQGSVWTNIRLSDKGASEAAVREAARLAGADEFVSRLPRGYDSVLGQMFYEGAELSGGQWQRIALARAYLRPSPVLVLDEPTSAMDSWSETEWFRNLRSISGGRAVAVVTHRLSVAMQADRVVVMDDGRVVEAGTHSELVARGGRYASSWHAQLDQAGAGPWAAGDGSSDLAVRG